MTEFVRSWEEKCRAGWPPAVTQLHGVYLGVSIDRSLVDKTEAELYGRGFFWK